MDDERFERVEEKIDRIADKISNIDVTLAKQHESLKIHIKRTELLEKEVAPIKKHVNMVQGVIIFLSVCATVMGILHSLRMFR